MLGKEEEKGGIYMMYTIEENYSRRRRRRRRRRNATNSTDTKHYKNPKSAESL
jgi:hypothetical protein